VTRREMLQECGRSVAQHLPYVLGLALPLVGKLDGLLTETVEAGPEQGIGAFPKTLGLECCAPEADDNVSQEGEPKHGS
jgi:hypothetical protein